MSFIENKCILETYPAINFFPIMVIFTVMYKRCTQHFVKDEIIISASVLSVLKKY